MNLMKTTQARIGHTTHRERHGRTLTCGANRCLTSGKVRYRDKREATKALHFAVARRCTGRGGGPRQCTSRAALVLRRCMCWLPPHQPGGQVIPDRELSVLTDRGVQLIGKFLERCAGQDDWAATDHSRHRARLNLLAFQTTDGPLCWLCGANVAARRSPSRIHTACKHCCANDAVAARELGLRRLLPVRLTPGGTVEGTVAEMDHEDQSAEEALLSNWFFDARPAHAWTEWLVHLLALRGAIDQVVDVSLVSWQKAVGATRRDAAQRYMTLLDMRFPQFIEQAPMIGDPDWLAT